MLKNKWLPNLYLINDILKDITSFNRGLTVVADRYCLYENLCVQYCVCTILFPRKTQLIWQMQYECLPLLTLSLFHTAHILASQTHDPIDSRNSFNRQLWHQKYSKVLCKIFIYDQVIKKALNRAKCKISGLFLLKKTITLSQKFGSRMINSNRGYKLHWKQTLIWKSSRA